MATKTTTINVHPVMRDALSAETETLGVTQRNLIHGLLAYFLMLEPGVQATLAILGAAWLKKVAEKEKQR